MRDLARQPSLLAPAESISGRGVSACSGPNEQEGVVTASIALDDATLEDGCLHFGEGTNPGPVCAHAAPADEPCKLQLPAALLARQPLAPAAVRRAGLSFHPGNTCHRSAAKRSTRWRRACGLPCVNARTCFEHPALPYDERLRLQIS